MKTFRMEYHWDQNCTCEIKAMAKELSAQKEVTVCPGKMNE